MAALKKSSAASPAVDAPTPLCAISAEASEELGQLVTPDYMPSRQAQGKEVGVNPKQTLALVDRKD